MGHILAFLRGNLRLGDDDDTMTPLRVLAKSEYTTAQWAEWKYHVRVHGILMILGWCSLIPLGMASSRWLRHRQAEKLLYFRVHYPLVTMGTGFTIGGWAIALRHFHSLHSKHAFARMHSVLGMVVMYGVLVSILLYPLAMSPKPSPDDNFETFSRKRKFGYIAHKFLGYLLLLLAIITCVMGTYLCYDDGYEANFQRGIAGLLAISIGFAILLAIDNKRQTSQAHLSNTTSSSPTETTMLL